LVFDMKSRAERERLPVPCRGRFSRWTRFGVDF